MEAVAKFQVDFSWGVPVISAEGQAVVVFDAAIGYVQGCDGGSETFAEIFAEREIEGGVLRQVISRIGRARECVGETGAVINIG